MRMLVRSLCIGGHALCALSVSLTIGSVPVNVRTVRTASPTPAVILTRGATLQSGVPRFIALDGGRPVAPHILVTALTVAADGTIYAGGNYTVPNNTPYAGRPIYVLGSAWLVSHDHGATWTQQISTTNVHAFPKSGVAPWPNHAALPIDFTPASITIDPHNAHIIYVAGCTDTGGHPGPRCSLPLGGPMVVRSTDGGRTWGTSLSLGNIVPTPSLQTAYRLSGAHPTQGYAVVVDPRNSRRLYAAVSGLGVLRSMNGGRTWMYAAQPQSNQTVRPCELVMAPGNPNELYELDRAGALYRTTDAGAHWAVRAPLNTILGGSSFNLTFVGHRLYITAARGLYSSTDGGARWRLAYPPPVPGDFYETVRGAGGWISAFGPTKAGLMAGLYAARDGKGWQAVADTNKRGRGALDFEAIDSGLATRLWEDHLTRIVFTAGPLGGLYRWKSRL